MSKRWWGVLALLVLSEALGIASGHWYFGIYKETVPAAVLTSFNESTAYAYYLYRGGILGLVLFAWSFVGWLVLGATWTRSAEPAEPVRKSA